MRKTLLVAVACLVGGSVEAQGTAQGGSNTLEELRRAVTAVTALRDGGVEHVFVHDSVSMNRATLGISLGGAAHKRDTLGVFVESVVENGPAERAGIYEGHRIASINGVDVRASAADAGDEYLSGVGRHRLTRAMRDVTAGGTVALRVWTGSGYRDVQVVSGRFQDVYRNRRFSGMEGHMAPGSFSFGPGFEHRGVDAPKMRIVETRPTEVRPLERRAIRARKVPVGRATPPTATPRAPRTFIAPSVPQRLMSEPGMAPPRMRRYTI